MFQKDVISALYAVDWTRQVLALAALRALIPPEYHAIQDDTERRRTISAWYRTAQTRSMDRDERKEWFRFSPYTAVPSQTALIARAAYWSPSTYHRLYKHPIGGVDAGYVDTIPCLFADLDYTPGPSGRIRRPYWGDIYLQLLDADLTPTMIVDTPRGYHLYWYLDEALRMRWEKNEYGTWRPMPGAVAGLAWWRDVSFGLHRRLIALGIPADTAGAGTPARLLRMPHRDQKRRDAGGWCHHYDPETRWTLDALNKRIEEHKMKRTIVIPGGRRVSLAEGVDEGERNSTCWRLALSLASEYRRTPESGWRALAEWCGRCSPAYPEAEARPVWRWALRRIERGDVYVYKYETGERTRREQGPYAAKMYRSKTDEKIAVAVAALQAEGVPDPWQYPRVLAKKSGIPERTIRRRLADMNNK